MTCLMSSHLSLLPLLVLLLLLPSRRSLLPAWQQFIKLIYQLCVGTFVGSGNQKLMGITRDRWNNASDKLRCITILYCKEYKSPKQMMYQNRSGNGTIENGTQHVSIITPSISHQNPYKTRPVKSDADRIFFWYCSFSHLEVW